MNLFKELVITAPVSTRLQFGINENIIVTAVDTSVRKVKGLPVKSNTFITFTQVDPKTRKALAQSEFSFFNIDPTSEYVASHFVDQFTTMFAIVNAMGADVAAFDQGIMAACAGNDPDSMIKTKDGAKVVQEALQNSFYDAVKDLIGDKCPLMKCKLSSNKKAYLEMGRVANWILPMDGEEVLPEVTAYEIKAREEALASQATAKQAKPDEVGAAKPTSAAPEKAVGSPAGFGGL